MLFRPAYVLHGRSNDQFEIEEVRVFSPALRSNVRYKKVAVYLNLFLDLSFDSPMVLFDVEGFGDHVSCSYPMQILFVCTQDRTA